MPLVVECCSAYRSGAEHVVETEAPKYTRTVRTGVVSRLFGYGVTVDGAWQRQVGGAAVVGR